MWLLWTLLEGPGAPGGSGERQGEDRAADRETVRLMAAGDHAALGALFDRYSRQVFSLILRIVVDQAEAEDVAQEVFSQVWRQADRYEPSRGPVAAWLLTIARSRAIDRVRSRRAKPDALQLPDEGRNLAMADPAVGPDAALITHEQVSRLRDALSKLPLLQRLAIELAYYEGFTQVEIAERLEQPLGTVKTRIRLGLLKLRDAMAEAGR